MSTIEHVKCIFGQRVRHIILAPRNLQALNAALQEESRLIPKVPNHQNYSEYPNVWLTGEGGGRGH